MIVRTIRPADVEEAFRVEQVAWGDHAASRETIARRASIFEAGSIVVLEGKRVVGYAASQLTTAISTTDWNSQTDHGQIVRTHRPEGRLAYGVSMSALPGVAGKGVAFHVIAHYARMYLDSGACTAMCVGSRVPGFAAWSHRTPGGDLDAYLAPDASGRHRDPELKLYGKGDFRLLWGLPNYFPDARSLGHGAMMIRTRH